MNAEGWISNMEFESNTNQTVRCRMKEFREKLAAGEIDKHGQPIVKAEDAATSDETASENN